MLGSGPNAPHGFLSCNSSVRCIQIPSPFADKEPRGREANVPSSPASIARRSWGELKLGRRGTPPKALHGLLLGLLPVGCLGLKREDEVKQHEERGYLLRLPDIWGKGHGPGENQTWS